MVHMKIHMIHGTYMIHLARQFEGETEAVNFCCLLNGCIELLHCIILEHFIYLQRDFKHYEYNIYCLVFLELNRIVCF